MKVLGGLIGGLRDVPATIRRLEAQGYAGAFSAEINNDPFLPALLAAEHSEHIELTTAIAVAFARNPMNVAQLAHDLNEYAGGRFVLGLGSQVQAHITRRYGMPWSRPAARMREFILALRAIWACWHEGTPLRFEGEFYRHTLMTPMFVPASREHPAPKVRLAGVGPLMTAVAAEVGDGLIAHGFTTERYLREVTEKALAEGLARAGKQRADIEVIAPIMVVTGEDEAAFLRNREAVRGQLAFYASTPAYADVLTLHGWEALGRAHRAQQGRPLGRDGRAHRRRDAADLRGGQRGAGAGAIAAGRTLRRSARRLDVHGCARRPGAPGRAGPRAGGELGRAGTGAGIACTAAPAFVIITPHNPHPLVPAMAPQ